MQILKFTIVHLFFFPFVCLSASKILETWSDLGRLSAKRSHVPSAHTSQLISELQKRKINISRAVSVRLPGFTGYLLSRSGVRSPALPREHALCLGSCYLPRILAVRSSTWIYLRGEKVSWKINLCLKWYLPFCCHLSRGSLKKPLRCSESQRDAGCWRIPLPVSAPFSRHLWICSRFKGHHPGLPSVWQKSSAAQD